MAFKECRQAWDFGSKIRMNYEPNGVRPAMDFGTAIHAGLETLYDPQWPTTASSLARAAAARSDFVRVWSEYKDGFDLAAEWDEYCDLGMKMLDNYFQFAATADRGLICKMVEVEFEVPIKITREFRARARLDLPNQSFTVYNEQLHYKNMPVYYQGRIDALMQDEFGLLWIWDHKTAAKLDPTEHLEMDEQTGSYCWAMQEMLGIKVHGVVYNELVKDYPVPPKVLKSGQVSQDKTQRTNVELYEEMLAKQGLSVVGYEDFLTFLKDNPRQYVRRTQVHRTQKELQLLGERIALEAIDMLNDPSIYPAPNRFKCGRCAFRSPCLAKMDGSDYKWLLDESFHLR